MLHKSNCSKKSMRISAKKIFKRYASTKIYTTTTVHDKLLIIRKNKHIRGARDVTSQAPLLLKKRKNIKGLRRRSLKPLLLLLCWWKWWCSRRRVSSILSGGIGVVAQLAHVGSRGSASTLPWQLLAVSGLGYVGGG